MIDPAAKYLTHFFRVRSVRGFQGLSLLLLLLSGGLVLCAAFPSSSSLYRGYGGVLPVLLYVAVGGLFGFSNTCVFRYFKERHGSPSPSSSSSTELVQEEREEEEEGEEVQRAYKLAGVAMQSGALIGSVIAFGLVVSGSLEY